MKIVAAAKFWGIGKQGLLFRLKEDMLRLNSAPLNKVAAMGHNTLKSLPGRLPGQNLRIVLAGKSRAAEDVEYFIKFYRYINNNVKDFNEVYNEN